MKRSEKVVLVLVVGGIAAGAFYAATRASMANRREAAMARLVSPPTTAPQVAKATANAISPPHSVTRESLGESNAPVAADSVNELLYDARNLHGDWPWRDFVKEWRNGEQMPEAMWREGERLASAHEDLIASALALSAEGELRLPEAFDGPTVQALADLLLFRVESDLRRGNVDGGVHALTTVLEFCAACAPRYFSNQGSWQYLYGYAYDVMYRSLPAPLPEPLLERLTARLNMANHRSEIAADLVACAARRSEYWSWYVEGRRGSRNVFDAVEDAVDTALQHSPRLALYRSPAGRALVDRDIASYLDLMSRTRDAILMPYREALPLAESIEHDAAKRAEPEYLVDRFPPIVSEIQAIVNCETLMAIATVGLHVERYRADFGKYPDRLDDLAIEVPMDPFSGGEFIYKNLGDRFLLYSIGRDLRDDGGAAGDIVWRHNPLE